MYWQSYVPRIKLQWHGLGNCCILWTTLIFHRFLLYEIVHVLLPNIAVPLSTSSFKKVSCLDDNLILVLHFTFTHSWDSVLLMPTLLFLIKKAYMMFSLFFYYVASTYSSVTCQPPNLGVDHSAKFISIPFPK
jgi:hypothetical protein